MRPLPPGALRRLAAALPRLAATLTAACFLVSTAQANCEVIGDSTCKDGHYCEGGIYDSCEPCPHSNCKDCGSKKDAHSRAAACTACKANYYGSSCASPCTKASYCNNHGTVQQHGIACSCASCDEGYHDPGSRCNGCAAGYEQSDSTTTCTACPSGRYSPDPASECLPCGAGFIAEKGVGTGVVQKGATSCTACPIGQYNDKEQGSGCQDCSPGQFADTPGSQDCQRICSNSSLPPHSNCVAEELVVNIDWIFWIFGVWNMDESHNDLRIPHTNPYRMGLCVAECQPGYEAQRGTGGHYDNALLLVADSGFYACGPDGSWNLTHNVSAINDAIWDSVGFFLEQTASLDSRREFDWREFKDPVREMVLPRDWWNGTELICVGRKCDETSLPTVTGAVEPSDSNIDSPRHYPSEVTWEKCKTCNLPVGADDNSTCLAGATQWTCGTDGLYYDLVTDPQRPRLRNESSLHCKEFCSSSAYEACMPCPAGQGPSADNASICTECIGAKFSARGIGQCEDCEPPNVVDKAHLTCQACPAGHEPNPSRNGCVRCSEPNTYSERGEKCVLCKAPNVVKAGRTKCSECPQGRGPDRGRDTANQTTICKNCTGARQYSLHGQCTLQCNWNQIANAEHTGCDACEEHTQYIERYSDVHLKCGCKDGYYDASKFLLLCFNNGFDADMLARACFDSAADRCLPCPDCFDCTYHGNGTSPALRDGYMMKQDAAQCIADNKNVFFALLCSSSTSVQVSDVTNYTYFTEAKANLRCARHCNVNDTSCPDTIDITMDELPSSATTLTKCSDGYAGHFCRSCESAEPRWHLVDGECRRCGENNFYFRWVIVPLGMIFVSAGFLWWGRRPKQPAISPRRTTSTRMLSEMHPSELYRSRVSSPASDFRVICFPTLKTCVSYAQVVTQLGSVMHMQYPSTFAKHIAHFRPVVDVSSWNIFMNTDCLGYGGFRWEWVIKVLLQPAILCMFGVLLWSIELLVGGEEASDNLKRNLLRVAFLCYPTICNMCFSAWSCQDFARDSSSLIDDDRVDCWSSDSIVDLFLWNSNSHLDMLLIRWASLVILVVFGLGAPFRYAYYVACASINGANELTELEHKPLVRKFAAIDLVAFGGDREYDVQLAQIEAHVAHLWLKSWRYRCHWKQQPMPVRWGEKRRAKLEKKLKRQQRRNVWKVDEVRDEVEAVFIETTKLRNVVSMTDAYRPGASTVGWEAVVTLRKFALVGAMVLTGRGSVAQNVCATVLSCLFFAFHIKMWPMKTNEDNLFRASAELHIFWTITTAFVLRSDLEHEAVGKDFYDWCLVVSFWVCLPCAFATTIWMKYQHHTSISQSTTISSADDLPRRQFQYYRAGLASTQDYADLKSYFDVRIESYELLQLFDELADDETGLLELGCLSRRVQDRDDTLRTLIDGILQRGSDVRGTTTSAYLQELQRQVSSSPMLSFEQFLTWHENFLTSHTPAPVDDGGTPLRLGGACLRMSQLPSRSSLTEGLAVDVSKLTGLNSEPQQPQPESGPKPHPSVSRPVSPRRTTATDTTTRLQVHGGSE
eukprot:COSAG02_NODE_6_length_64796_cov_76.792865_10_plen_1542_part_00